MSNSKSYAETVNGWEELLTALGENSVELPQLNLPGQRLHYIVEQIKSSTSEQAALTASRQQATERVYYLLAQGRKLATVLRASVREHYGNRSQKIAEFGLQPLHTRPRSTDDNPLPPPE